MANKQPPTEVLYIRVQVLFGIDCVDVVLPARPTIKRKQVTAGMNKVKQRTRLSDSQIGTSANSTTCSEQTYTTDMTTAVVSKVENTVVETWGKIHAVNDAYRHSQGTVT